MKGRGYTARDQRQYSHVLASEEERGLPIQTAKRIAASTVNKLRAEQGRTLEQKAKKAKRTKKA